MATLTLPTKACTVNPLKMSRPLGACYAFLGMDRCMPVMHGAQGCTSFGLVLLVRHFKEAIPLQTTAMNEVSTILGGYDNIEKALLNIKQRANPALIAIASTGLTETKGDDVPAFLKLIRQANAPALGDTHIVYAPTPDYIGGFEDGWADAVTALIETLVPASDGDTLDQVNLLPGSHLTSADIDELRDLIADFGLATVVLPDVSGSLDGHMPDQFTPTTLGGTRLEAAQSMGRSRLTLAIGEHMHASAVALHARTGVPYRVFARASGLTAVDAIVHCLASLSGRKVPARYVRQRSQLQDAMLDAHFHIGGKRFALACEPDLLYANAMLAYEMGARITTAITPTPATLLEGLPCEEVVVGDLEDLANHAEAAGCDIIVAHSHGRHAAQALGVPHIRTGLPMFDRLGAAHRLSVGYRGTRDTLFEWANALLEHGHAAHPDDWPLSADALAAARGTTRPAPHRPGCSGRCAHEGADPCTTRTPS
ncbi:MAG: nitrogenase iron-molybdenum cofactor biosynthesis protein NifN [Rhodocyclaceae bacterium]